MQALVDSGLIEEEIAERYRMEPREARQQPAAVEYMNTHYFPITSDPSDPVHRTKFSYFLEYFKNGRIQAHAAAILDLPKRFARWVRDGTSTPALVSAVYQGTRFERSDTSLGCGRV
jgi:hypothetical protein